MTALHQVGSQVGRLGQYASAEDTNGNVETYVIQSVTLTGATYQLLDNAGGDGDPIGPVVGGAYIWAATGTWNGATAALEYLGPDGATYIASGATLSADGAVQVQIGAGAMVKVTFSGGTPAAMYSSLT